MSLFLRVYQKLYRSAFRCRYNRLFKSLGSKAYLVKPFRVDGGRDVQIEDGTSFQRGAWLYCIGIENVDAMLHVGKDCIFGYNNHITSVRHVSIGDNVLTANNIYISDNLHEYEDQTIPVMHQAIRFKSKVIIGDGAWIGENVSIIGASVGRNSVIGANSVVTHDIPDFCVAVGAPARVIRQFDFEQKKWVNQ
jgi:tetrahydrodipicolinate N-succinyltransferase